MPRLTHDEPGMVYACPACDTCPVVKRTDTNKVTKNPERPFRCEQCGATTYYVVERESRKGFRRDKGHERWQTHREAVLGDANLLDVEGVSAD